MEKGTCEVLERARVREFYRYYPPSGQSVLHGQDGTSVLQNKSPKSSPDPALTALAQLGALRLNTKRALISLFDCDAQYILAEATRTLSLQSDTEHELGDELLLGCSIVPRVNSLCSLTLDLPQASDDFDGIGDVLVINDVAQDARLKQRRYLAVGSSSLRFYAGTPIRSPDGINIGAYCVMDDKPRNGLDERSCRFLQDTTKTIMEHLRMARAQRAQQRHEGMVRGIGNFIQGKYGTPERPSNVGEMFSWSFALSDAAKAQPEEVSSETPRTEARGLSPGSIGPRKRKRSVSPGAKGKSIGSQRAVPEDESVVTATSLEGFLVTSRPKLSPGVQMSKRKDSESTLHAQANVVGGSESTDTAKIFSRASHIIREALELEGVIFFEVNMGSSGSKDLGAHSHQRSSTQGPRGDEDESRKRTFAEKPYYADPQESGSRRCAIHGFSTLLSSSDLDSEASEDLPFISEAFITELARSYPVGRVIRAEELGDSSPAVLKTPMADAVLQTRGTEEKLSSGPVIPTLFGGDNSSASSLCKKEIAVFRDILPEARNIAFLPLWDFHRRRWCAATLAWSNDPTRVLNAEGELGYLTAFGNSVMAEVARLDAVTADRAKADFISSISHELRSPLHGILGNAEFLRETQMNSIQERIVHNIDVCGKTLLDTISHVLDFAKINNSQRFGSLGGGQFQRHTPSLEHLVSRRGSIMLDADVDISTVIEEVTDTVFAGHVHRNPAQRKQKVPHDMDSTSMYKHYGMYAPDTNDTCSESSGDESGEDQASLIVILDIDHDAHWNFITQSGAWRRILMNCLGNSLKYTNGGYIMVKLSNTQSLSDPELRIVTLTLSDTGRGISERFLKDFAYTPFTQEDPHMAGIGLGLSIMRQMVTSVGGVINIWSEVGVGTEVEVSVPMRPAACPVDLSDNSKARIQSTLSRNTKGLRVGLVGFDKIDGPPAVQKGTSLLESSLRRLCEDWFDMEVIPISDNTKADADLYIATQPGDEMLMDEADDDKDAQSALWRRVERQPVIIICPDASVPPPSNPSSMQGSDGDRIVHFIPQPCGPEKLAQVLNACFKSQSKRDNRSDGLDNRSNIGPRGSDRQHAQSKTVKKEKSSDVTPDPTSGISAKTSTLNEAMKSSNMMLVEDNSVNLQLLEMFMKKMGYSYRTAVNGLEALNKYKLANGAIDCILMDISMPIMNGMEATREIRRHEHDVSLKPATIIALTGLASAEAQQEAHDSGFNLYLIKPVKFQALTEIIHEQGH